MILNQISMQEARKLFEYRDGTLFWRQTGSGRRTDLRAVWVGRNKAEIKLGGKSFKAQYVVWNWHHGITPNRIMFANGDKTDIRLENLREVETIISAVSPPVATTCPCCSQSVPVQSAYIVAVGCGLKPMEYRILDAIWHGNGMPVSTEKIFDRMYDDDPDGGPPPARMYATLKESMVGLRKKLVGSGVGIETVGYRAGWRLILGGMKNG